MSLPKWKPRIDSPEAIRQLPRRIEPYWQTLEFCRHVGVQRHPSTLDYWSARVRTVDRGHYRRHRLGQVDFTNQNGLDYEKAVAAARAWFKSPDIVRVAVEPFPVGVNQHIKYTKKVEDFTVGDALKDYVEWKRVSATKKTFESLLSLINHHLVPRLGNVPVANVNARLMTSFMVEVLETPPKYGKQTVGSRLKLAELSGEHLRKRKKTVNTLLGILKLALQMAWENGEFEEERIWRTIRRLPHKDAPRHLFLSRKQCQRLLENCEDKLGLVVLGALYTGCRIGELADLTICDVEPGIQGLYISPSKSSGGRYVFLPDEGVSFFRKQCVGKQPGDPVFQMQSGRSWNGNHKHLFKQAVRAAGLPDNFVFHGLRHTYASQLVQAGTPLAIVARQLGHANTDTVSRTYGHLSCKSIETEIQARFAPMFDKEPRASGANEAQTSWDSAELAKLGRQTSWPHSNFSKASGQLVHFLRGR